MRFTLSSSMSVFCLKIARNLHFSQCVYLIYSSSLTILSNNPEAYSLHLLKIFLFFKELQSWYDLKKKMLQLASQCQIDFH